MELIVESDPERAGRAVRTLLDEGERAAGFLGDADDPALAEFVADVIRPQRSGDRRA